MVLEENVRVSCISLPALLGGKAAWRAAVFETGSSDVDRQASCGIRLLSKVFGQNCSKTPNMGWIVDWRGWEGPEVPGMEVRFFPMAARSTVRGSQLEGD